MMKRVILTLSLLIALAFPPVSLHANHHCTEENNLYDTEYYQDDEFIDTGYAMMGVGIFLAGLTCLLVCLIPPSPADPPPPPPAPTPATPTTKR